MKLYRVVKDQKNFMNEEVIGANSFIYDEGETYYHFFILPENAITYQKVLYDNQGLSSLIYQCDIPYEVIKNNFGIGMYHWYYEDKRTPFLECRLNEKEFKKKYIIDKCEYVKDEWENKEIYYRFMKNCVDESKPLKSFDGVHATINEDFNFLDYFPKEDLIKENIDTTNYPNPIKFEDINYFMQMYDFPKRKKKRLVELKEKLINFYKKEKTKKKEK